VPFVWISLLTLSLFAAAWATGGWVPRRATDTEYVIFVLGWFATVFVWTRRPAAPPEPSLGIRITELAAVFLLAAGLITSANVQTSIRELRTTIPVWHHHMQQRFSLAREAATEGGVFVASRPNRLPRSLAKIDLNPSPKHRINRAFAAVFGLDSVILETPSRGKPRARAGRRGGAR
jgi:hypothetical protein